MFNKIVLLSILLVAGCSTKIAIPTPIGAKTAPPPPPMATCPGAYVGPHCMQTSASSGAATRGHHDESKETIN